MLLFIMKAHCLERCCWICTTENFYSWTFHWQDSKFVLITVMVVFQLLRFGINSFELSDQSNSFVIPTSEYNNNNNKNHGPLVHVFPGGQRTPLWEVLSNRQLPFATFQLELAVSQECVPIQNCVPLNKKRKKKTFPCTICLLGFLPFSAASTKLKYFAKSLVNHSFSFLWKHHVPPAAVNVLCIQKVIQKHQKDFLETGV